jgi:hypothetical protein
MAKEANLQIRLYDDQRARIERIARAKDLPASTWARAIVMREVRRIEAMDARRAARDSEDAAPSESAPPAAEPDLRRVAEPGAPPHRKRR